MAGITPAIPSMTPNINPIVDVLSISINPYKTRKMIGIWRSKKPVHKKECTYSRF